MRKSAVGLAFLAALFAGSALPLGATPASAEHPNTVCSYWSEGDGPAQHVQADWMAGRSFRVTITDLTLRAAEGAAGDAFVPLPLDPNMRLSTNTVTVGEGLEVSDVAISQGVTTDQPAAGSPSQIDNYRKLPHAPWEAASVSGGEILWLHDIDARSDGAGVQGRPSELASPAARAADAAGVLDFTVTVPEGASGEVWLLRGMSSTVTGGVLDADSEQWIPGATSTRTLPGCSVTVEAAVAPQQEPAPAERAPAKKPGKTRGADADTRGAAKHGTDKHGTEKQGAAYDDAAGNKRRDSASEDRGGNAQREPSVGSQTQPPPTGKNDSEASASESAGDAVARSGGANSAPWLVAAGGAVAVGVAVGIASLARARGRRDAPGTAR